MPITRTSWTDDDGTGLLGTLIRNSELQAIYDAIDAAVWDVSQLANAVSARVIGPSSVGSGSTGPSYEGDVTISTNQTLEGVHYYNTLTINTGVVVTANKALVIIAKTSVTLRGTITADGAGMAGGAQQNSSGTAGNAGTNGTGAAGGGGGGAGQAGGDAGSCVVGADTVAGGAGGSGGAGGNATALTTRMKGFIVQVIAARLQGGAGGGGGANFTGAGGAGGAGGGVVVLISPTVDLGSGTISAKGSAGANGSTNSGGGGGGGGGVILVETVHYTSASTLNVSGGTGGTGAGAAGKNGGNGGTGIIQVNVYAQ